MIQLSNDKLTCSSNIDCLAQQFAQAHAIRLPQLLHPDLLRLIWIGMEAGPWVPREHDRIGRELSLSNSRALAVLHFSVSTPEFLRLVARITACPQICRFVGRVYRMEPSSDHYDSWHDDAFCDRLVGMSINLGPQPYHGGVFRLRPKHSEQILCELPNTIPGDAILFRISSELTHMVTPVEVPEPKTAYAGWFVSTGTDFFRFIRQPVRPGVRTE